MAWEVPGLLLEDGSPLDPENLRRAATPAIRAVDGSLNEHNFADREETGITPWRHDNAAQDLDGEHICAIYQATQSYELATGTGVGETTVPQSNGWVPIHSLDIESDGGAVEITWDLQYAATSANQSELSYGQFAFEVDGSVVTESNTDNIDTSASAFYIETGVGGWAKGVTRTVTAYLPPGSHTIQALARCLPVPTYSAAVVSLRVFKSRLTTVVYWR